jgi:N,N-dimethylformamidase
MKALAYFEEWSRRPGQKVRMAISSELPEVQAIFVQLLSGPGDPKKPGLKSKEFPEILNTVVQTRVQSTRVGSYASLPLSSPAQAPLTVHLHFWPTLPDSPKKQVILAVGEGQESLNLELIGQKLRLSGQAGQVEVSLDVQPETWYSVAFSVGANGVGFLDVARRTGLSSSSERVSVSGAVGPVEARLLSIATDGLDAVGSPRQPFNGKVEGVTFWDIVLEGADIDGLHSDRIPSAPAVGRWDFSQEMHSLSVVDTTNRNPNGCVVGGAERGVTSHAWSGLSDDYQVVPNEYAAIQFHEDEMLESNWEYDLEFDLPEDIPSGLYGVRLNAPDFEDCYPLFVASRPDQEADVLFLFSTNTYMAYANDRLATMGEILSKVMSHELVVPEDEKYLHAHDELGRSCYDTHSDGTAIRFTSRRRPIINVRPGYPNFLSGYRHFPADMYLLEWVARSGQTFHIATDDDVETDGINLFRRYKTIVTSCHPEYWTLNGLDSLGEYLKNGGRIMYLGGNGFYWVTSIDPERPWIMEVRRDNSGTRCWNAPAGERTHLYGGVPGGLWRWRGRGPNKMLGVGFASEGWNVAQPFQRQPASYTGKGKEWFEGISAEAIGDKGYLLGGVAGDEVDRYDLALGSPAEAEILCTATGFGNEYQLVIEDQLLGLPNQGGVDRQDVVRCDMVYFSIEGGGAVFSGSSIAYCGALAWNNFENDLETVTTRVLRSFCASLPGE